jgi:ribosomal protein L11 methyltransferase
MDLRGKRVLDVGTGTGVLAFAALLFGARSGDRARRRSGGALHARTNARLNGLSAAFFAGSLDALGGVSASRFDLALVNVIPEEIADDLPRVASLLPGGEAILSGILAIAAPGCSPTGRLWGSRRWPNGRRRVGGVPGAQGGP